MRINQSFVIKWLALFLVGAAIVTAPGRSSVRNSDDIKTAGAALHDIRL